MKLSEIEEVGKVVQDGPDYGLIESKVIQGITTLPVGTLLVTSDQMQDYAKECIRAALMEYVGPYSEKKATAIISKIVK
ncbi:hypothetical protein [Lactococcus lactis]|uniref:hypothetical protein n=1 Tax=Lactococcus lactis TaxID=1358 RepID=UPI000BA6EDCB|nr:hypothetical protein [Lactococcus lactis]PAL02577.1 hypothetical protein B8W91_11470 [Lactococcus lactis]